MCRLLAITLLAAAAMAVAENLNPKPKSVVSELGTALRFEAPAGGNELLSVIAVIGDSVIVGGRDAVYNLSASTLDPKFTIPWKASGQTVEECLMKGKSETECHNYIRVVTPLRNGRWLVCGTNAFSPLCREFDYSAAEDRFVERHEFAGHAIAPFDPLHNSTFVYVPETNEIFVGTVSDIGGNDPLLYRKRLPRGESLRTQKDDPRVMDRPDFVGSFVHKEHVYFWYRERAAESGDSTSPTERQIYARVGRVCQNDHGGPSPANDRWSSFLKARLNCSIPAEVPFYFNELQSISGPVDDGSGDPMVFAVFQTTRSTILMSAVCGFRMSAVAAVFDHGHFKSQRSVSPWSPRPTAASVGERPGRCVADSRRLTDISFITKNPLLGDMVAAATHRPLIVEGPARPELTAIHAMRDVRSARAQRHHVLFVGRADGSVAKLVDSSAPNQSAILVANIRVFDSATPIVSIKAAGIDSLIVASRDKVVRIGVAHCGQQVSCAACVRLRDPHCGWDLDKRLCVQRSDWSSGSFVQNILSGVSEQCPNHVFTADPLLDANYVFESEALPGSIGESNGAIVLGHLEAADLGENLGTASNATTFTLVTIGAALVAASIVGFLIGLRISKWRSSPHMHSGSSPVGSSSGGSDSDSYGQLRSRLTRHDSLTFHKTLGTNGEHVYASAPISRGGADAVSLVFNSSVHMPMMGAGGSVSNGCSAFATPRLAAERNLMLSPASGATLPRDYRVRKVYL